MKVKKISKMLPGILFGLMVLCVAFWVIKSKIALSRIDEDGVYVISFVSGIEESKSGKKYYFDYAYKGDTVHFMYKDLAGRFKLNDLYFFRILKDKPEVNQTMFDTPVPSCITLKSMPYDGWKTFPTCP